MYKWWAYIHLDNGQVIIKRFIDDQNITEDHKNSLIKCSFGPIEAESKEEAEKEFLKLAKSLFFGHKAKRESRY